jgi:hypothetical protein
MNPYYEVVYPKVDKNKLVELAHLVAGRPIPKAASTPKKPVLYLRRPGGMNANTNRNVYGNDTNPWRTQTQSASSSTLGNIAAQRRIDERRAQSLRDLGRMVRGY